MYDKLTNSLHFTHLSKMPEFYIMFARKIFSGIFFSGGSNCPLYQTPVAGPQAPHQLNPALDYKGAIND